MKKIDPALTEQFARSMADMGKEMQKGGWIAEVEDHHSDAERTAVELGRIAVSLETLTILLALQMVGE